MWSIYTHRPANTATPPNRSPFPTHSYLPTQVPWQNGGNGIQHYLDAPSAQISTFPLSLSLHLGVTVSFFLHEYITFF